MKLIVVTFLLVSSFLNPSKDAEYVKNFENGYLKEEGWLHDGVKSGFWKFYDEGAIVSQGHFENNKKTGCWHYYKNNSKIAEGYYSNDVKNGWWTFFNVDGYRTVKKQFDKGMLNGYGLFYKKSKLSKVKEYKNDKALGEWTSYWSFKVDHPEFSMSDLKN